MKIIINLDNIMTKKRMSLFELAEKINVTNADLYSFINNKAEYIELSTLAALCKELDCQPGDLLKYIDE
ncbi:MAG: helix-turn-helix domain-containing protein [Tissierellia bacterium]|nr:helix-turn-helix domain-containing protein [Tissierellia bacterium]